MSHVSHGLNNFELYTDKDMVWTSEDGHQYCRKFGNRREVIDGVAYCTTGRLTADRLEERDGKIISKTRSEQGKTRYASKNPFKGKKVEEKVEVKPEPEPEPVRKQPAKRGRARGRRGRRRKRARVAVV